MPLGVAVYHEPLNHGASGCTRCIGVVAPKRSGIVSPDGDSPDEVISGDHGLAAGLRLVVGIPSPPRDLVDARRRDEAPNRNDLFLNLSNVIRTKRAAS